MTKPKPGAVPGRPPKTTEARLLIGAGSVSIWLRDNGRAVLVRWVRTNEAGDGLTTQPATNWQDLEGYAIAALPPDSLPGYYRAPVGVKKLATW